MCVYVCFKLLPTKTEFWTLHCLLVTRKHSMPHIDFEKNILEGIQLGHLRPQLFYIARFVDKALFKAKVLCQVIHETCILLESAALLRTCWPFKSHSGVRGRRMDIEGKI